MLKKDTEGVLPVIKNLFEKLKEALQAVLPIGAIVLLLHFTVTPLPWNVLAAMLLGMVWLILGLTLFSLGTEMAMMPMGSHIGSTLIKSKNIALIVVSLLVFGFMVTAAEPGLTVFASQLTSVSSFALIVSISLGVGIFLVLAAFRTLFRWNLSRMLLILYGIAFAFAFIAPDFFAVAFDASAITTGPVTVPFLLAIGAGFAAVSSNKDAEEDNFGISSICSVGPIIGVLILGMFQNKGTESTGQVVDEVIVQNKSLLAQYALGLWQSLGEVLVVIVPIVIIFMLFQITRLKLSRTELVKIGVGLLYLLIGLAVFLTGVNQGFMEAAGIIGTKMGELDYNWILIPLCLVIGAGVVLAEPAVHVLAKQVEDITDGAISGKMLLLGMAGGVGCAMSLAMVRMLLEISVWFFILPGFLLALLLTFFVPPIFVGIGFDSGGIAAGAMTAAFVLPFTIGVSNALGLNPMAYAFGVVGMIAMMPPIAIQLMGIIYSMKLKKARKLELLAELLDAEETEGE